MIWLVVLLIAAHALTESAELIEKIFPRTATQKISPFINYVWPHDPDGISLLWWLKYNTEDFLWCCTFFVLARVTYPYSRRFFMIACAFFVYHLADWFMLWYNYKQSHFMYWLGLALLAWCIGVTIWPKRLKAVK